MTAGCRPARWVVVAQRLIGLLALYVAQTTDSWGIGAAGQPPPVVGIVYIAGSYPKPVYLSLVEKMPDDAGRAGAALALEEINTTGRLLGTTYKLDVARLNGDSSVAEQIKPLLAKSKIVVADLEPRDLLSFADMPEAKDALILDIRTRDDDLRQRQCRRNVFHLSPSIAMRTDAIGQYLAEKRWYRWFLLRGTSAGDEAYAAAVRRTAKRYGAKIVEDRPYGYDVGARRVDTGYQQIQTQMPLATRGAPAYDVLIVADTSDTFGDYLPYATAEPRPVAGTQGLIATSWHPGFQEYSALQMQHRFELAAHRGMLESDYSGWLALRTIGEAVLRSQKTDVHALRDFLVSPQFQVAGFKGQGLTFRTWDLQMRQPVLLASPLMVVSMSPQEGFLHPKFLTDTLGYDEPETECHFTK